MRGVFVNKLPIYYEDVETGRLEIEQDGLYLRFDACAQAPVGSGVLRLWAVGAEGETYLGVMAPEGDRLALVRRLPARSCVGRIWTHGVLAGRDGLWRPYSGIVASVPVTGALRRTVGGAVETALPFDPREPFAWLPLLPRLRAENIGGASWLVLREPKDSGT